MENLVAESLAVQADLDIRRLDVEAARHAYVPWQLIGACGLGALAVGARLMSRVPWMDFAAKANLSVWAAAAAAVLAVDARRDRCTRDLMVIEERAKAASHGIANARTNFVDKRDEYARGVLTSAIKRGSYELRSPLPVEIDPVGHLDAIARVCGPPGIHAEHLDALTTRQIERWQEEICRVRAERARAMVFE